MWCSQSFSRLTLKFARLVGVGEWLHFYATVMLWLISERISVHLGLLSIISFLVVFLTSHRGRAVMDERIRVHLRK